MGYANGAIPTTALSPVPGFPGAWLTHEAADSFKRVRDEVQRKYGWTPTLTSAGDAYRSYARQEAVFRERYVPRYATYGLGGVDRRGPWLGQYWWRYRGAAAAVPGTSNHGKGVAVDIKDIGPFTGLRYRQFAEVAAKHGWSNVEGKSVNEPWHWVYSSSRDTYPITNPIGGGGTTIPDIPEIDPIKPIEPLPPEENTSMIINAGVAGLYLLNGGKMFGLDQAAADEARAQDVPYISITPERFQQWLPKGTAGVLIRSDQGPVAVSIGGSKFAPLSGPDYQGFLDLGFQALPVPHEVWERLVNG